ncbi:MAG: histidine phosphatase family protein [Acidimicrobiales bacterium]
MKAHLVRHADAGDRARWQEPDFQRPLSPKGQRQSTRIMQWFVNCDVTEIHSSPALRCHTTVQDTADACGIGVVIDPALGEGMGPQRMMALIEAQTQPGLVICAHGDGIPETLRLLELRGLEFPGARHRCAKASIWTIDLAANTAKYTPPPR